MIRRWLFWFLNTICNTFAMIMYLYSSCFSWSPLPPSSRTWRCNRRDLCAWSVNSCRFLYSQFALQTSVGRGGCAQSLTLLLPPLAYTAVGFWLHRFHYRSFFLTFVESLPLLYLQRYESRLFHRNTFVFSNWLQHSSTSSAKAVMRSSGTARPWRVG